MSELSVANLTLLAVRDAHVRLNITLYGRKGICCRTQVQGWAFEMNITPAVSSYIGIKRVEDDG